MFYKNSPDRFHRLYIICDMGVVKLYYQMDVPRYFAIFRRPFGIISSVPMFQDIFMQNDLGFRIHTRRAIEGLRKGLIILDRRVKQRDINIRYFKSTYFYRFVSKVYTQIRPNYVVSMMTSSNGNIFRVTGHLCGEFTCLRWISRTMASDAELWCFLWSAPE